MQTEIRIGGLGGQGIILAGQILGRAAVYDGKNAVQTQSYGAEARGSLAKSEILISDTKIGFPMVRKCNILIAMNQEAIDAYLKDLKDDSMLIVDSTYVKEAPKTKVKIFRVPATETAEKTFGARVYANILMLGALARATGIVSSTAMEKAIEEATAKESRESNREAFKRGAELVT